MRRVLQPVSTTVLLLATCTADDKGTLLQSFESAEQTDGLDGNKRMTLGLLVDGSCEFPFGS